MNCPTQPPADAETEQAIKSASSRGDFSVMKQMSRQGIRNAPNECGWYVLFVHATLKSPPATEAEADDALFVIREFQQKKLPGHDWETVQYVKIEAFSRKSELAFARGDFDRGAAELRKMVLFGDAVSKARAHIRLATAYGERYFKTQSRGDAAISRDGLRAALGDSVALKEFLQGSPDTANVMMVNMHGMLGLMENDLGNFTAAMSELETAQSLAQKISELPDATISKMIVVVKQNLQGSVKRPGVRIVSIQEIVEALK